VAATGTFNPLVAGSNPARPTKYFQEAHEFRFVGFCFSGPSLVASVAPALTAAAEAGQELP
jgi:hypothetical protein